MCNHISRLIFVLICIINYSCFSTEVVTQSSLPIVSVILGSQITPNPTFGAKSPLDGSTVATVRHNLAPREAPQRIFDGSPGRKNGECKITGGTGVTKKNPGSPPPPNT